MKTRVRNEINRNSLLNNEILTDEYIFRELAREMVSNMMFEDLKKIIKFTKVNPFEKRVIYYNEFEFINMLKEKNVILFEAECNI